MSIVYIIDDDALVIESLTSVLKKEGFEIVSSTNPHEFLQQFKSVEPAVVIADIFFNHDAPTGDEIVSIVTKTLPNTQCIVISGESDINKTISCLRNGAIDFIEKPLSIPRLITAVKNAFRIYSVKTTAQERFKILGESQAVKNLTSRILKLAPLNECVLICGENGTGKEYVANNIHLLSNRYTLPMVSVNCTSLNPNLIESELFGHISGSFSGAQKDKKGLFSAAKESSLFIDEIGDFDILLQSKLLRVIQEKSITPVGAITSESTDVRMIFATHQNLQQLVLDKLFREDLYYRISTFIVDVPPLRNRLEDIDSIANNFLTLFLIENKLPLKVLSSNALEKLKEYHYPGNIRELGKIIKNAALFCEAETIDAAYIDFESPNVNADVWSVVKSMSLLQSKDTFERELVLRRLKMCNFDISKTAESLGMIRNNLYRKMKELQIEYP